MSFFDELNQDARSKSTSEVESAVAGGGLVAEGLHHAFLDGFREVQANSGTKGRELVFKILAGPSKGLTVKDTLWTGDKEQSQNRMLIFGHRLGLLQKSMVNGKSVYTPVEGKTDLVHCFGAEVIIDVVHEKYTNDKGQERIAARLSFEGVLPLDDKRAAKVARGKHEPAAASNSGALAGGWPTSQPAAQANQQQQFADL